MARTPPSGGLHAEISLPHSEEWELYHNSFSLCSKKLRVCLAELSLPYRGHHVHLIETGLYENVRPAFLRINPGGTVPVLVHQGHPVYESHDQIVYAAAHAGDRGTRLMPPNGDCRQVVERWIDRASLVGDPRVGMDHRAGHCIPPLTFPLFATMVRYIPMSEILRGLLTHPHKERPLFFALLKTLGVTNLPSLTPVMNLIRAARSYMGTHLDALGRHLDGHGRKWIAGDEFTLADISWVVILDRIVEAGWEDLFWGDRLRPSVAAYWDRLRSRPSFSTAIDAQRCENTLRGIMDLRQVRERNPALREALQG